MARFNRMKRFVRKTPTYVRRGYKYVKHHPYRSAFQAGLTAAAMAAPYLPVLDSPLGLGYGEASFGAGANRMRMAGHWYGKSAQKAYTTGSRISRLKRSPTLVRNQTFRKEFFRDARKADKYFGRGVAYTRQAAKSYKGIAKKGVSFVGRKIAPRAKLARWIPGRSMAHKVNLMV